MEWIDDIILGLLDTYATSCPYELCAALRIRIIRTQPANIILLGNESTYIREYLGRETIFLRDTLTEKEELFFIRHELGHAILHPSLKNSYNKFLINKHKIEKEANYFAFKLSNVTFDEIELYQMTLEQIASCVGIPHATLKQLANF